MTRTAGCRTTRPVPACATSSSRNRQTASSEVLQNTFLKLFNSSPSETQPVSVGFRRTNLRSGRPGPKSPRSPCLSKAPVSFQTRRNPGLRARVPEAAVRRPRPPVPPRPASLHSARKPPRCPSPILRRTDNLPSFLSCSWSHFLKKNCTLLSSSGTL